MLVTVLEMVFTSKLRLVDILQPMHAYYYRHKRHRNVFHESFDQLLLTLVEHVYYHTNTDFYKYVGSRNSLHTKMASELFPHIYGKHQFHHISIPLYIYIHMIFNWTSSTKLHSIPEQCQHIWKSII